jgi:hypothetical protein
LSDNKNDKNSKLFRQASSDPHFDVFKMKNIQTLLK